MDDDDTTILAEIRHRLAEHGERADDFTNDDLRAALRVRSWRSLTRKVSYVRLTALAGLCLGWIGT